MVTATKVERLCEHCQKPLQRYQRSFCCPECYHSHSWTRFDKEVLADLYLNKKMSTGQICTELHIVENSKCKSIETARESVRKALLHFGIPLRSQRQAVKTRQAEHPYDHCALKGERHTRIGNNG